MKPLCLCSGGSVSMQYDLSLDCILHSSGGRKRTLGLPPIPQCPLAEAASVWLCFRSVPLIYECLHEQSERLQCGSISALWMAAGHAGNCQVSLPSRAAVHQGQRCRWAQRATPLQQEAQSQLVWVREGVGEAEKSNRAL